MDRYYFHFEHSRGSVPDEEGVVLSDPAFVMPAAMARADAVVLDPARLCDWGSASFRIVDAAGRMCLVVSLLALLAPREVRDQAA